VVIHQLFESNTPQWQKVFTIVVLRVIDLKNYVLKRKLYKEYTTKGNLCLHICNLRVPHLQIVYTIVNLWVLDLSHVPLNYINTLWLWIKGRCFIVKLSVIDLDHIYIHREIKYRWRCPLSNITIHLFTLHLNNSSAKAPTGVASNLIIMR